MKIGYYSIYEDVSWFRRLHLRVRRKLAPDILMRTGNNSGNLLFQNGIPKLVGDSAQLIDIRTSSVHALKQCDVLVFGIANLLNPAAVMEDMSERLTKLIISVDRPVLVIGLGAQSTNTNQLIELGPKHISFLKEVSSRTKRIFVRGQYTKRVCNHYGIENVTVAGCPSILLNQNLRLGETIECAVKDLDFNRIGVSVPRLNERHLHRIYAWLLGMIRRREGLCIAQDDIAVLRILMDKKDLGGRLLSQYPEVFGEFETGDAITKFVRNNFKFFSDIRNWQSFIENSMSGFVGTRIHGSVMAMTAGVPSVCICIDSRTKELCDVLKIPNLWHEEVNDELSVRDLFGKVRFDGLEFDDNRKYLAQLYVDLFDEYEIPASRHLRHFVE
jgi:polysaccharide pyruvyl transferase